MRTEHLRGINPEFVVSLADLTAFNIGAVTESQKHVQRPPDV